jgi:hypothetical protein
MYKCVCKAQDDKASSRGSFDEAAVAKKSVVSRKINVELISMLHIQSWRMKYLKKK